jgi:hypothetical protein
MGIQPDQTASVSVPTPLPQHTQNIINSLVNPTDTPHVSTSFDFGVTSTPIAVVTPTPSPYVSRSRISITQKPHLMSRNAIPKLPVYEFKRKRTNFPPRHVDYQGYILGIPVNIGKTTQSNYILQLRSVSGPIRPVGMTPRTPYTNTKSNAIVL